MAEYARPFGLSPVIEVDTQQPVDLEMLLKRIQTAWQRQRWVRP